MRGYINGIDWLNIEPMKYWAPTASMNDAAKQEMVRNAIFGGDYIGALKVDGYYQRVLKDEEGNIFMIARSRNTKGEIVDKHEWVPQLNSWFDSLPSGTCFLCECYWPGNEGSKNITSILGCLKDKAIARQKDNPLHLYVFDIMAYNGVNYNKMPYGNRAEALRATSMMKLHKSEYVEWADFYEGQALWTHLQSYLASGREGMVIMRKDAIVYNKRTPARVSIKCKKEIKQTIDCFFTGMVQPATKEYTGKELETWQYWIDDYTGEKKNGDFYNDYMTGAPISPITKGYYYGWAGSLQIGVLKNEPGKSVTIGNKVYNDKAIEPIGWLSNLVDQIKAQPSNYLFIPLEVTAMEIFDDGKVITLRHGKALRFRDDLTIEDCNLEKIRG